MFEETSGLSMGEGERKKQKQKKGTVEQIKLRGNRTRTFTSEEDTTSSIVLMDGVRKNP